MTGGDNTLATASAIKISLSPLTSTLTASGTQQFTATVSNAVGPYSTWESEGTAVVQVTVAAPAVVLEAVTLSYVCACPDAFRFMTATRIPTHSRMPRK